jgi:ATP-dependent RNA helicase RhlE
VLVATPGRLLDLMGQGHVALSDVAVLVFDEADRLLDMGFLPDVRRLVGSLPDKRQTVLFSATMPDGVTKLARSILRNPVRVDSSPGRVVVKGIRQRVIMADRGEKRWILEHLLRDPAVSRALVFTRTRQRAEEVARDLLAEGIGAECLHGQRSQRLRQQALENFRSGASWVLVATDVAARGIHVEGVSHVINYDLPDDGDSYVHRIGRTARLEAGRQEAGKGKARPAPPEGMAWTLCEPSEVQRLRAIERRVGRIPTEEEAARGADSDRRPSGKGRRRR